MTVQDGTDNADKYTYNWFVLSVLHHQLKIIRCKMQSYLHRSDQPVRISKAWLDSLSWATVSTGTIDGDEVLKALLFMQGPFYIKQGSCFIHSYNVTDWSTNFQ